MELTRRQALGGGIAAIAVACSGDVARSNVGARSMSSIAVPPEDSTYWHDLLAAFVEDSIPAGTSIDIPCKTWPKQFVFLGLSGLDVSFPSITTLSPTKNNFGLYQNHCAALRWPNATGNLGTQFFNACYGYNGVLDIYLPKITGFNQNDTYVLYGPNCHDKRFHFGVTCNEILNFNNKMDNQVNAEYATLIGTDGYLTWSGSSWEFNNFA